MPRNALNLVRLNQQPSRSKARGEEKPKIEVSRALSAVDFFRGGGWKWKANVSFAFFLF